MDKPAKTTPEKASHPARVLSEPERQKILREWNQTQAEFPSQRCVHQLFEAQADRTPEALAVIEAWGENEGGSLTYQELNARANQLAHRLRAQGVSRGARVGLFLERSADLLVGILGILKAGGAYVPIDPASPKSRVEYILQDARSPVLVTQSALSRDLSDDLVRMIFLDASQEEFDSENLSLAGSPDDIAYVIYTSGSTGAPKGVQISHQNVIRLFRATEEWFHFNSSDVWSLFHSYAFDFSVWEIWGALLYGGRLVIVPYWTSRAPAAFARLLSELGVTVLNQTPSAFMQLLQEPEFLDSKNTSSLRLIIFGGEALNIQGLQPWFEQRAGSPTRLVNMYGITETTVHVTYRPITSQDLNQRGSMIGLPIPDLQVYILDDAYQLVPFGVPGEICVGGAGLSSGYLFRPGLTAERFIPNPFSSRPGDRLYRSGDLGRYLPNGDIEYLGRRDNQVKIRGFRIELGEIEAMLNNYPGISQAVVMLYKEQTDHPFSDDPQLIAYLLSASDASISELRSYLKARLPDYMIPASFILLPSFPLTTNGKVDRGALPKPDKSFLDSASTYRAPTTAFEKILAQLWAEVLGVENVGLRDNFFDLGGHSLLAVRLIYRIEDLFQTKIALRALFEAPVLADFSRLIAEQGPGIELFEGLSQVLLTPPEDLERGRT